MTSEKITQGQREFSYLFNGYRKNVSYFDGGSLIDAAYQLDISNILSLAARYKEFHSPYHFRVQDFELGKAADINPLQVIKSCNYFEYQNCEFNNWKDHPAYTMIVALKERAICAIDEYDNLVWGTP